MPEKTPLQLALWIERLERRVEALEKAAASREPAGDAYRRMTVTRKRPTKERIGQ